MSITAAPPWWRSRRLLSGVVTALIMVCCLGTQVVTVSYAQYRHDGITDQSVADAAQLSDRFLPVALVAIAVVVALVWRHKWPVWISLGISA